jgi:conjugal transfer pilin signal peptidase TrbI
MTTSPDSTLASRWRVLRTRLTDPTHRRKVGRFCFLTAALLPVAGYAAGRYGLAIDPQTVRCLPEVRAVLLDRAATPKDHGDLVLFEARGLEPAFTDGTLLVKLMAGLQGDWVEISTTGVRVNGQLVAEGLDLATTLGHAPADFTRQYQIPEGHFLPLGTARASLDGRYYGPIATDRIRGGAVVLF